MLNSSRTSSNIYDISHINDIVKRYKTININFSLVMDLFHMDINNIDLCNYCLKFNDLENI
jgi:hypothetical protein